MKKIAILVTLIVALSFATGAVAVMKGKSMTFETKMGNVTFASDTHAEKAGLKCNDCHTKIYPYKKGSASLKVPHTVGDSCGLCHNGEKAFSQVDSAKCGMCHKK
jgi:c(7)-type cytochrome triheme protein